jgi:hypothetical protein
LALRRPNTTHSKNGLSVPSWIKRISGDWNGYSVRGNNLRLEGKDFAAMGIHEHLHPMNIVEIV